MLSQLWYSGLSASGLVALTRRLRRGGVILGYHNVVGANDGPLGDPGLHASSDHFEMQIHWLRERCEIVSLREMANRFDTGGDVSGTAAITFDDAYGGALQFAWPILRALQIPATVFVVAQAPGNFPGFWWDHPQIAASDPTHRRRWLVELRGDQNEIVPEGHPLSLPRSLRPATWEKLRVAVHEGLDIGCHSSTHRTLIRLDDDDLREEIEESREIIRHHLRITPEWFSYPFGIWDARVRDAIRDAGYRGAVTLDLGLNTRASDRWSLRRVNIPASISLPVFDAWSAGLALSASAAY